jgi:hypothetical protein
MKRGMVIGSVILSILLISLICADVAYTGSNPIYATANNSDKNATPGNSNTAVTSEPLATASEIIGRAICMNSDNFHGYYDIRTYEIVINESCPVGTFIGCRQLNGTEGWYDTNNNLVLAGTCPNYQEKESIKAATVENNRLRIINSTTILHCPQNCTCEGGTIKCMLPGGERDMTIVTGKSGNIIVQINGINASTNVTLYKAEDGKVYGVFAGNMTKAVNMLPDQVKERIKEKVNARLDNENITLNEDGSYNYTAEKESKLFGLFSIKTKVTANIDSQTGDIKSISNGKWWSFLASDVHDPILIVGANCGTVAPGNNDACCKNHGYDMWNTTSQQCEFSA